MFSSTKLGGLSLGLPPQSPIPTPYPNLLQNTMTTQMVQKVPIINPCTEKDCGQQATALLPKTQRPVCLDCYKKITGGCPLPASKFPSSRGDEAGVLGGIASGKMMGPAGFVSGSTKVKVGGMPSARLMTVHHGQFMTPAQTKVKIQE